MKSVALYFFLTIIAGIAQATPTAFTDAIYSTYALVDVNGGSDGPYNMDSSTSTLPFAVSASANNGAAGDFAEASAGADAFFLSARTSASAASAEASATAISTFTGQFTAYKGFLSLLLDFSSLGSTAASLVVTLDVGGTTLYDQTLTSTDVFSGNFAIPEALVGAAGLLDLTLTSISDAGNPGDDLANQSAVRFSLNQVPEPSPSADLLLGFCMLGWFGRANRRRVVQ